jgi:hypothetical protein
LYVDADIVPLDITPPMENCVLNFCARAEDKEIGTISNNALSFTNKHPGEKIIKRYLANIVKNVDDIYRDKLKYIGYLTDPKTWNSLTTSSTGPMVIYNVMVDQGEMNTSKIFIPYDLKEDDVLGAEHSWFRKNKDFLINLWLLRDMFFELETSKEEDELKDPETKESLMDSFKQEYYIDNKRFPTKIERRAHWEEYFVTESEKIPLKVREKYSGRFIEVFMSCLEPCWKGNEQDEQKLFINVRGISRLVAKKSDFKFIMQLLGEVEEKCPYNICSKTLREEILPLIYVA